MARLGEVKMSKLVMVKLTKVVRLGEDRMPKLVMVQLFKVARLGKVEMHQLVWVDTGQGQAQKGLLMNVKENRKPDKKMTTNEIFSVRNLLVQEICDIAGKTLLN